MYGKANFILNKSKYRAQWVCNDIPITDPDLDSYPEAGLTHFLYILCTKPLYVFIRYVVLHQ